MLRQNRHGSGAGDRHQAVGPRLRCSRCRIAYFYGYKAVGTLVYSWPEAYDKAKAADRILRQRLKDLGLSFEQILTEFVGWMPRTAG